MLQVSKPEGCLVEMKKTSEGLEWFIPASGVWNGTHGFFLFGLIFTAFPLAATVLFFVSEKRSLGLEILFPAIFVSIFWCVGLGILTTSLRIGTRKIHLVAGPEGIRIQASTIFGRKNIQWRKDELTSLRIASTGITVGDKKLTAIFVEASGRKRFGFAKALDRPDQEWILSQLRAQIGI
jgi:hypothetical protein